MNPNRAPFLPKTLLVLAAVLIVSAATTLAQTQWIGGTSDFNNPASWTGTYIGGSNPNCSNDSGSNNVVLIQTGDPVWQHGDTLAGNGDNTAGAYLQTGSTNNTGGGNWLRMGVATGSYGQYVLSNGVVNVGGQTHIGEYGVGYLEIDGGTYNANGGQPGICMGDADFGPNPIGTLVMNAGTINTGNEIWFGEANSGRVGTGHFIMHGGVINANNWFVFGRFGAVGDGYMDGGTINKNNNGNVQFAVGTTTGPIPARANFTQVGGVFNCGSEYQIGTSGDNSIIATNNIGGTAVLTVDNWFGIGRAGALGVLNISGNAAITKTSVHGGTVTIGSGGGSAGQNAVSYGIVDQAGGSFTNTATQTWVGETATGIWNLNSGRAVLGVVYLGSTSSGVGTFNLNGGELTLSELKANGGSGTLNLNGGTVHAGAGAAALWIHDLNGSAYLQAGGVTIDSAGFNLTISQPLWDGGGGGLTKTGAGTLTLSGANSYSGTTLVNAGTLATTTASFANGAVTVADGAGLGVQTLAANAQYSPASVSLGASTGAALDFDLGAFGNPTLAPLNITGNLAANGNNIINLADAVPQLGQFPLIKYGTRTGSGTFTIGSLPTGVVATLVTNTGNSSIDLDITSVNLPKWDGEAGGNWDIGLTTNWVNVGTGQPAYFSQNSQVLFEDSALGTTTVNLVTTVNPSTVTVNNSALSYAFAGSGKISGSTGLAKQGTGTLTITNTGGNNYTGSTLISDGVMSVTSLANGGLPSAIGASSSGPTNLVLAGGTLSYAGPAVAINRGYSVQTTNGTIETVNDLTLSGAVTASANGGFLKAGAAQLGYVTAGTNLLSAPGSDGYIVQAGTVLFDGSSGGQTNTIAGNRLGVDAAVGSASVILTNTTLNTSGNVDLGNIDNTTGLLTMNNGSTLTVGGWLILADGLNSVGTFTLNGGTLNVNSGNLLMGGHPGTTTTFNLNGGVFNKSGGTVIVAPGNWNVNGPRTGTINQTGGTFALSDEIQIGQVAQGEGFYNLHGGTMNSTSWFVIGRAGGSGTMIMDGGILNHTSGGQPAFIVGSGAGDNGATSVGFLDQSAGTLNCNSEYWVAENTATVGTNNIHGTAVVNVNNWVSLGRGGSATVNFSGGTFNKFGGGNFIVGDGGNAIWNQTGGTLTSSGEIWVGQSGGATGLFELSAGSVTGSNWVAVGRGGATGTLNISGGSFTKLGDNSNHLTIGSGGPGTVNQTGGTLTSTLSDTFIGEGGQPGIWNMNGGSAVLSLVELPINNGANGTLNLNGGTFSATEVTSGNAGGTGTLNFNGGTLIAGNGASANFLHDLTTANVMSGGAVIDSGTNGVGVNQALLDAGGGGLTKLGIGALNLNGANTYTGPTLVNVGTLGGTGIIAGPLTVAGVAALAPGAPLGTLTVNNTVALGGSTVMELSKDGGVPASSRLAVSGNLAFSGTLTVVVTGTNTLAYNDTFNLFAWGTKSGSFTSTILPAGYSFDTTQLYVNGTIRVIGVPPRVDSSKAVGGNLVLTGVGGPPGASYKWLTSTNVAAPLASWTTNSAGAFDGSGGFSNAIPINATEPARFFRLKTP
jgi:autotransporter-associated beta strand protein